MLGLVFAVIYSFLWSDKETLFSSIILSATLIVAFLLQRAYVAIGIARAGLELTGLSFFILYIPLIAVSLISYYLIGKKEKINIVNSFKGRLIVFGVIAVISLAILFGLFGNTLVSIASPLAPTTPTIQTVNATKVAIVQTTQELQAPSYSFLYSSFNLQLYLAPLGVVLFIIIAYLLFKNNKYIKNDHFKLNFLGFFVIGAYFLVTAYLQASAIRFNAIISIPLAIFAAFGLYAIGKLVYHMSLRNRIAIFVVMAVAAIIMIALMVNLWSLLANSFPLCCNYNCGNVCALCDYICL